ncbi:3-amino-5-hydroxybenzoic acid synthase family protein [Fadolivirus algeromassiliense]|jgi:dTDP-4-amino-4,6-dideoxygalactose transaminase|uniref:3-amino-5-hydroxybenzoic acid synthase family protein n=1 Tax=Fadolivirus FV1/VV64 TaxID=3070911 RepID=A0A7D3QTS4_9VIRU|nr:3-amino-5-hydroxybenzoic acid synthase family protein [Fadolivirus algeromassiliense]QKF93565.1 3-amino-5-hydroxybenzoic acid synthase family protein [Fadolivirus FV1/VV64]
MEQIKWVGSKNINIDVINKQIKECIETNIFTNNGPNVQKLQDKLREILQIDDNKEILMTCNGACGLNAIVGGLNHYYQKDLKYITQSFTFPCANQSMLSESIVVDIDNTMGPDINEIMKYIDNIDCIIVTNCFGCVTDIQKYIDLCNKYNKILIFDNAATPYTFYKGKNSINYASCSMISFHHTKQLGFSEGGAIIFDKKYDDVMRKIINFGFTQTNRTEYSKYASNYKMSELTSIYLNNYLENFENIYRHIQLMTKYFYNKLQEHNLINIVVNTFYGFENFGLLGCIPIISKNETITCKLFIDNNIEAKKYYYSLDPTCKVSKFIYDQIILLPCNTNTTYQNIDKYINIIINNK